MSTLRAACCAALLACGATDALAQAGAAVPATSTITVQAGAVVDRDTVTVGDVVRLTVRVRAPLGATVNFPTGLDSLAPVQALEPPVVRDGADSTGVDRVATYRLSAWDVGPQPIRLGDVVVQADDGDRRVVLTLPRLFVRSVLPADSAQHVPKPARDLLGVRAPIPWWWWALGALAALAVGLLIWWWIRRRRRAVRPTGDPFADAEAAFVRIERLRLPEAGEPGRHAALMTDVLRRYLAARLESASLAQTSGELLAAMRGVSTVPFDRLRRLLDEVDPVKFAAAPLAPSRARELGEEAKAIVREEHTRATAAPVPEQAAA
jgi:HAMP domain-containing protein